MAKTPLQLQSFLANNSYKTDADWQMISAFCKDKAEFLINAAIDPENGITASQFLEWYEHGFGSGDIVLKDGEPMMVGISHFKAATIVARLSDDKILTSDLEMATEGLKMAPEGILYDFRDAMFRQGLQFSWKDLKVIEKYIPSVNERIIYHKGSEKGLGVVRDVNFQTGEVELYCYFNYTTKAIGFSMHEKGIVNLQDFWFEPMNNGDKRQSKMNGISCQRRLNSELAKHGKTWNERLHRIEPLVTQVPKGKKYWYITDKMTLVQEEEKGLQLTRIRANAGNYFLTRQAGEAMLAKWTEDLRDYMALPETNQKSKQ